MSLREIPELINIKSSKYCNFEYRFLLTDTVNNQSKEVKVHGTSLLVCLARLEFLVSNRIKITEL